jgi:hypothetical protein
MFVVLAVYQLLHVAVLDSLQQALARPCPHLRRDWAHPAHICTGTEWARPWPKSTPGLQ